MTPPNGEQQLIRLASDNSGIYQDARNWFLSQGPSIAPILVEGLENSGLGPVAHWRILLLLRELALPSTLPAILKSLRLALERKDPIVLPGAIEAVSAFPAEEAVPALASVLQSGEMDDAKHAAALLGILGGDRAVESLAAALRHPQGGVRKSAVQALLKVNTARAHEALKRHREHEKDPDVQALMNSIPQRNRPSHW